MYACPKCHQNIADAKGCHVCEVCGFEVDFSAQSIVYDFDSMLFHAFNKKYLLNKVLNNNGMLSYKLLAEESLSLQSRDDVIHFKTFIEKNVSDLSMKKGKKLIDIGCGPLRLPGYLEFDSIKEYTLFGVEPEKGSEFEGQLITGCCEYLPIRENVFDVAVFATSFDHLCSTNKSVDEIKRVLKKQGRVFLWISDKSSSKKSWFGKIIHKLKVMRKSLILGYPIDKYQIYENGTVLYIPDGAIDPFHSYFESPQETISLFEKSGFVLKDYEYNNKNEVFLLLQAH